METVKVHGMRVERPRQASHAVLSRVNGNRSFKTTRRRLRPRCLSLSYRTMPREVLSRHVMAIMFCQQFQNSSHRALAHEQGVGLSKERSIASQSRQ
jgi:hypothetical protein